MHWSRDRKWKGLAVAALVCFSLVVGGCGSSSDDNDPPPSGPDTTPPVVTASPSGGTFGGTVVVTLSATDNRDPSPVIYYTTDLTPPDETSPVYTMPFDLPADAIVKFFAKDASGNASEVQSEGYVIASIAVKEQWAQSGHGQIAGEPWRHWDDDGSVQTSCAKCHSAGGFVDFAEDGTVDDAADLPLGLECSGCHQGAGTLYDDLMTYPALENVLFPSGETATLHGASNMCMSCHQGRASKKQVDDKINGGPPPYSFTNIHYYAAAASMFGAQVHGGYEFDGLTYQGRNTFPSHTDDKKTCVGCHMRGDLNDHTFLPQVSDCSGCHGGATFETLGGSPGANHAAIATLADDLLDAIQTYAGSVIGTSVAWDAEDYPYWYVDDNGNGVRDPGEDTPFALFDENLLPAAYNYHYSQKEPCAYIHNGTYMQQLLYDASVHLGGMPSISAPGRPGFDVSTASKTQQWQLSGHGDMLGEPFNHWAGSVPSSCSRCHSTPGFVNYANGDPAVSVPTGSGVECTACHESPNLYASTETRWEAQDSAKSGVLLDIVFPSGASVSLNNSSNMCMACHQGRASKNQVDDKINGGPPPYTFTNIHYYAAAATLFGTDVDGGYEYAGKTYRAKAAFVSHGGVGFNTCTGCHMQNGSHTFLPVLSSCTGCHGGTSFETLGLTPGQNYTKIQTLLPELYDGIRIHANGTIGTDIAYDGGPDAYPYWFVDDNGNGVRDPGEDTPYVDFDAALLKAAYNYQVALKDPAGYIHNGTYVVQLLFDSIEDLGGTPSVSRP